MGLFTFLLVADAVEEMGRHNRATEDQMRRALLTPAERAAEDAERAAEEARRTAAVARYKAECIRDKKIAGAALLTADNWHLDHWDSYLGSLNETFSLLTFCPNFGLG